MNVVTNTQGIEVQLFSTHDEAVQMIVREPLAEFEGDFDVDAIADAAIEWHTEYVERDGQTVEWLPGNGFCSALDDDPDTFWRLAFDHQIDEEKLT